VPVASFNSEREALLSVGTQPDPAFIQRSTSPLTAITEWTDEDNSRLDLSEIAMRHRGRTHRRLTMGYKDDDMPGHWQSGGRTQMWQPIWLRKTVLCGFVAAFIVMLLSTALLYHFSLVNQGLSTQSEVNHYGWKYGPTAGKSRRWCCK
jgi:hypothetical protein